MSPLGLVNDLPGLVEPVYEGLGVLESPEGLRGLLAVLAVEDLEPLSALPDASHVTTPFWNLLSLFG